jgi:hypothetical protein
MPSCKVHISLHRVFGNYILTPSKAPALRASAISALMQVVEFLNSEAFVP